MNISTKLAVDFVKRNFGAFQFESQPCQQRLTAYHLPLSYVAVGCADLHLFAIDTDSTSCMMMSMPKCLKPATSSLDEMLRKIERDDMDMSDYLGNNNVMVRVTTNRLLVLEKLMKKSGFIHPLNHDFKDLIAAKITEMQSEASTTYANTLNKLNELWEMIRSKC